MSKSKETKVEDSPTNSEESTKVPPSTEIPTNLGLDDIQKLVKLIDIAAEKSIFKPADFISIGQTYIKLVQILQSVTQK